MSDARDVVYFARAARAAAVGGPPVLLPGISLPAPPAQRGRRARLRDQARHGALDYAIGLAAAGTPPWRFPDNPGRTGAVPRHAGNPGYSGTLT
jgi:hypothetical protein